MITANGRFWLVTVLVTAVLVYLLAPILTPFVFAALLAYLADPLVDRMERWSIAGRALGRTGAVVVVFAAWVIILVLVLLWLVPMLERQIGRLINELPRYFQWFQETALPWITERLGLETPTLDGGQVATLLGEHWRTAGGIAATVVASVSKSGMAVISWVVNLLLIPVVAFYLMRDWDTLVAQVDRLVPRPNAPVVRRLARESDQVLGAFLRGQMLVMLALATIYSVGLWIVGINLALLIGLVAGLISFVPYLGAIVGVGMAVIAALVQFGELWPLVGVAIVFSIGQTVEGFVLQPLLLGDRIGLHPVAVIFAIMAGASCSASWACCWRCPSPPCWSSCCATSIAAIAPATSMPASNRSRRRRPSRSSCRSKSPHRPTRRSAHAAPPTRRMPSRPRKRLLPPRCRHRRHRRRPRRKNHRAGAHAAARARHESAAAAELADARARPLR
ncbi:AI-2E family transporter [Pseudofulvimonas gallinarii]|uniref:AI-2E family transporter n=1 Tax=Pseudofulvimonas gallinarii TaxID=634155 RepID=UPI0035E9C51F